MARLAHRKRTVILGANGCGFHDFNMLFRANPSARVVAFTAAQIPVNTDHRYPPTLSGPLYPLGIAIEKKADFEALCRREKIEQVVFADSDVPHDTVIRLATRALSTGADFLLPGPRRTMLPSILTVIAVSAVRTGCGKSQVARWLSRHLCRRGIKVAVLPHPMPHGDLKQPRVQRFATRADLDIASCTIAEREQYEPHIAAGNVVFAGADYTTVLATAEKEACVILWEGGSNDFPFVQPDLHLVLVDALRPDQLTTHHPSETMLRMADVIVVNKVDAAPAEDVVRLADAAAAINPQATIVRTASPVRLDDPAAIRGRTVLVVEDGPTITHGGMSYGAGYMAATNVAGVRVIDPRESATPEITAIYDAYPHIGRVLPATGYAPDQRAALARTINGSAAEVVVSATTTDLTALIDLKKPVVRAHCGFAETEAPGLGAIIDDFLDRRGI